MKNNSQSESSIHHQTKKTSIEEKQANLLTELGSKFRQKRLEQSITLEEMAVHTMIRVEMLHAIEEGKLERLPEPVYIQGLLLRYANALGFNGREIAQDFPVSAHKKFELKKFWFNVPLWRVRPFHLYFIYIATIVVAIQTLSNQFNQSATQTVDKEPEQKPTVLVASDPASSANPVKATAFATAQQPRPEKIEGVRVGLTLQDTSWVLIEADGKTEFEGTLPSGTERSWQANEKLVVLAGNAGGVLLAVNNGQAEKMGAPGQVIEREVLISQP